MLKVERLTRAYKSDIISLNKLLKEAFPEKDYINYNFLKKFLAQKNIHVIVVRDEQHNIRGMMSFTIHDKGFEKFTEKYVKTSKYIRNRGIASNIKGGGTALINYLSIYKLDIVTKPKPSAKKFYLKLGFKIIPGQPELTMIKYFNS